VPGPPSPQPPPVSRELGRVLREQLAGPASLRLVIGEALDQTGIDGSYTNVRIAGADYVIPKLDGPTASIPQGRAVYVLADSNYNTLLAIGSVRG